MDRAVVDALDRGQARHGGVDRVGEQDERGAAAVRAEEPAQAGKARRAAATAACLAAPPRATSASFQPSQSIGLRTSNVSADATRRPSM